MTTQGERPPIGIVLAAVRRGEQLCLVRRSSAVRTSRGAWGVVTGYLEPGVEPEAQAWVELVEELGLEPPALRLVRSLPAVPLTSEASGKRFLVYPFLFESASAEVTLNWEHDAVEWAAVYRLAEADCVPWQEALVLALLASETG
jgi:8-oxo-dGTP pyrophosphatase MutT (NUDIX family)